MLKASVRKAGEPGQPRCCLSAQRAPGQRRCLKRTAVLPQFRGKPILPVQFESGPPLSHKVLLPPFCLQCWQRARSRRAANPRRTARVRERTEPSCPRARCRHRVRFSLRVPLRREPLDDADDRAQIRAMRRTRN